MMDKKSKDLTIKIVVIVVLVIVVTIIATNVINAMAFRHTEGLVYRTETGECYHSPGCGYLNRSAIPMGYERAKASSLRSCSRCGGNPEGTIIVDNYALAFSIVALVEFGIAFFVLLIRCGLQNKSESITVNNDIGNDSSVESSIPIRKGSVVMHPKWEIGEVISIEDRYIIIRFNCSEILAYNDCVKKFQYPDAVGKYFDVIVY